MIQPRCVITTNYQQQLNYPPRCEDIAISLLIIVKSKTNYDHSTIKIKIEIRLLCNM